MMNIRSMRTRFGLPATLALAVFATPISALADENSMVKVSIYEACSKSDQD